VGNDVVKERKPGGCYKRGGGFGGGGGGVGSHGEKGQRLDLGLKYSVFAGQHWEGETFC